MDALIFPTYDSKQNTNITMNDLDFDTISKIVFPIGSIYSCFDNTINPNTFLYGKWEKCQDDGYFIYSDTQKGKSDEEGIETISQYTGATTLTLSQIQNHTHNYRTSKRIKVRSGSPSSSYPLRTCRDWNTASSAQDVQGKISYEGEDGSHSHKMKHNHTIDVPSTDIIIWIRKE